MTIPVTQPVLGCGSVGSFGGFFVNVIVGRGSADDGASDEGASDGGASDGVGAVEDEEDAGGVPRDGGEAQPATIATAVKARPIRYGGRARMTESFPGEASKIGRIAGGIGSRTWNGARAVSTRAPRVAV
ncbi:hypothetical protein FHR83_007528 [Actinoplanes campanulatus]|uniref:Uncharacterized protein n=1 Tax=Actinoplanes campanulatus TaxID=113559 RepID=A0A7W5AP16_9ACTN|nr:hypothetical protein [Actinoplanes campanulatus]MBB3099812.1 hypothetical protein [Actinoplanes campanulatus]GGN47273.1 hypothetical protein GCM10010109_83300 [Actinoplanes campanulatus]GID40372.1 hypothetical protein Aca09nite_68780 [Actinoplanes campanulatus]